MRTGALVALGRIGDVRAKKGVEKMLDDRSVGVRSMARWALQRLGKSPGG
ncbi:MAG: hypothetical protein IH851_11050 [Armatimonadetes bacterium]|nr:hypothetical protein [Armatimonadota bacterium]